MWVLAAQGAWDHSQFWDITGPVPMVAGVELLGGGTRPGRGFVSRTWFDWRWRVGQSCGPTLALGSRML